ETSPSICPRGPPTFRRPSLSRSSAGWKLEWGTACTSSDRVRARRERDTAPGSTVDGGAHECHGQHGSLVLVERERVGPCLIRGLVGATSQVYDAERPRCI